MARGLTAAMVTAVQQKDLQLILLLKMLTDGGAIRVWTGIGNIVFETETYTGVGQLGSVSLVEETLELAARGIALGLSGVPSSRLSEAFNTMRQGRDVTTWLGVIKTPQQNNFITNGFFEFDIAGWTDSSSGDGSIAFNPLGYLNVTDGITGEGHADQQMSGLDITKQYYLNFEVKDFGAQGVTINIGTTQASLDILSITNQTAGLHKVTFSPTVTNPWIRINATGLLTNDTISVDNVIILENEPFPLVLTPYKLFQGQTDVVQVLEGKETSRITVNAENRLVRLEHKNERRFTKQDQERFVPGDLGLDYVLVLQDKEIVWGRQ